MPTSTRLHQLADARPERLDRLPLARPARVGRARARDRRGRRRRRHLEPDDLRRRRSSQGDAYDEQIADAATATPRASSSTLAMRDVAAACDLLRPVWERTEAGDGYVSIEVDPTLAADTEATIAQATHFHEAIARPNLLVKIPATDAGVPAIEEMTARGYSINVTLIFSLSRHRQVAEAYLRGLERLVAAGGDPAGSTRSPASSSRASTPRPTAASPKPAATTSRAASASPTPSSPTSSTRSCSPASAGKRLAARGATTQRCLWASTSTKDPSLPRHALRRGADRAGDDLDDARGDDPRLPRPRPRRARGSRPSSRTRSTCSTSCTPPASTTTTSSPRSSARASRSSSPPSTSSWRGSTKGDQLWSHAWHDAAMATGGGTRLLIATGEVAASEGELPQLIRALIENASELLVMTPISSVGFSGSPPTPTAPATRPTSACPLCSATSRRLRRKRDRGPDRRRHPVHGFRRRYP